MFYETPKFYRNELAMRNTGNKKYSQGGFTSGRRPVVKIIAESLSQHDEKYVYRPRLVWESVGRRNTANMTGGKPITA
jgi:hypothetical protein